MFEGMHPGAVVTLVVTGAFGLAIVAVILSQRAQTSNVIGAASSGLSSIITAAVAPVMGSTAGGSGGYIGNALSNPGFGSFLTNV